MEKEAMRLAKEELQMERSFAVDDIVVLHAQLTLPQCEGRDRRARRFNRYYRRFAAAYFTYCQRELLPQAAADMRSAVARSAPWSMARVDLSYTVTLERGDLLSLYTETREEGLLPRLVLCRADNWNLYDGLPLLLGDCFPADCRVKRRLLQHARETLLRKLEEGGGAFYPHWRFALRRFFSARNFYLTEQGLVWFYPMYTLAGASAGIVRFSLSYGDDGPFLPPRS